MLNTFPLTQLSRPSMLGGEGYDRIRDDSEAATAFPRSPNGTVVAGEGWGEGAAHHVTGTFLKC